jgi:hypothetical protein
MIATREQLLTFVELESIFFQGDEVRIRAKDTEEVEEAMFASRFTARGGRSYPHSNHGGHYTKGRISYGDQFDRPNYTNDNRFGGRNPGGRNSRGRFQH